MAPIRSRVPNTVSGGFSPSLSQKDSRTAHGVRIIQRDTTHATYIAHTTRSTVVRPQQN